MIQWLIKSETQEWAIETGPITILKSANSDWYILIRAIEDFFVNKQTMLEIYEDTQLIYKKDWECLFIPYDAHLSLDKLTAKSPLKPIVDELTNQLALSPYYHQLQELWNELKDELTLQNEKMGKYELKVGLNDFLLDDLKKFIFFSSTYQYMIPIKYKLMLLELFVKQSPDKKRLIIIELPELYAEQMEIKQFLVKVFKYAEKGVRFIIVTNKKIQGNCNYLYDGTIVNETMIQNMKDKIINDLPFNCNDELFELGKTLILATVDNSDKLQDLIGKEVGANEALATVMYVISKHIGLRINIDLSGFSKNVATYFKSY